MSRVLSAIFIFCFSTFSQAITVEDNNGSFILDYLPKRIVSLEFSFSDVLTSIGVSVSPLDIADNKDATYVLKNVRDDALFLHKTEPHDIGVIRSLDLSNLNKRKDDSTYHQTEVEQLTSVNTGYLILGHDVTPSIVKKWENEALRKVLKASSNDNINPNTWSRSQGIIAEEHMSQSLMTVLSK